MTTEPGAKAPRRRQIPGEPLEEPSQNAHTNGHGTNGNGHHVNSKQPILLTMPLSARPGAPVALAEGQGGLDALHAVLPQEWAAAAFPTAMWSEIDWSCLTGRRPIIIPENTPFGADRASKLEEYLRHVGIAASVLALPEGIPEGWKLTDGMPEGLGLFNEPLQPRGPLGQIFSAADLDEQEFAPLEWIIEGWLPVGLTFLVGASKLGKSWMAMDWATEIAAGRDVFGKISTKKADVLYLALEDGPRRLQSRMRKMLGNNSSSPGLTFATEWPTFDKGGIEKLAEYLDAVPTCRVIIVDILARVRGEPDDKKSVYLQDYKDIGELQRFSHLRNIALVLVHHTRKQDASDALDRVSGSTGMVGAADTIMILTRPRGEPNGKLVITGRDIIDDGEFAVVFNKETAKWTLLGPAAQVKAETEQKRIYDLLLVASEPMTGMDISAELEIGLATVRSALQRMKSRGAVLQLKHGIWGIVGKDYKSGKNRAD